MELMGTYITHWNIETVGMDWKSYVFFSFDTEAHNSLTESHKSLKEAYDAMTETNNSLTETNNSLTRTNRALVEAQNNPAIPKVELLPGSGVSIEITDLELMTRTAKSYSILAREILRYFFSMAYLQNHSLSGRHSNADMKRAADLPAPYPACDKAIKDAAICKFLRHIDHENVKNFSIND
jgi:hypothetical protein